GAIGFYEIVPAFGSERETSRRIHGAAIDIAIIIFVDPPCFVADSFSVAPYKGVVAITCKAVPRLIIEDVLRPCAFLKSINFDSARIGLIIYQNICRLIVSIGAGL